MESRSNVICAKLAYMNSLALSVGASNQAVGVPRSRDSRGSTGALSQSMMRPYRKIGIEHRVPAEPMMAKFAEGENQ
jgi:hypothetical protein